MRTSIASAELKAVGNTRCSQCFSLQNPVRSMNIHTYKPVEQVRRIHAHPPEREEKGRQLGGQPRHVNRSGAASDRPGAHAYLRHAPKSMMTLSHLLGHVEVVHHVLLGHELGLPSEEDETLLDLLPRIQRQDLFQQLLELRHSRLDITHRLLHFFIQGSLNFIMLQIRGNSNNGNNRNQIL